MRIGENKQTSKLLTFSLTFLIFCSCVNLAACQSEESFDSLFKECQKATESNDTEKAIACFEKATKINSEDAGSYIYLANEYKKSNRLVEAEETIKRAIKLRPERASAHGTYGEILELKGDLDGALKERQESVRLQPKVGIYWIDLAFNQEKLNNFPEAVKSYNQALVINPNDTAALYFSGLLYEKTGNLDKAIENLKKYNNLKPEVEDVKQKLESLEKQRELESSSKENKPVTKKGKLKAKSAKAN